MDSIRMRCGEFFIAPPRQGTRGSSRKAATGLMDEKAQNRLNDRLMILVSVQGINWPAV